MIIRKIDYLASSRAMPPAWGIIVDVYVAIYAHYAGGVFRFWDGMTILLEDMYREDHVLRYGVRNRIGPSLLIVV